MLGEAGHIQTIKCQSVPTGLGKRVVPMLRKSRLLAPSGSEVRVHATTDHSFAQPCTNRQSTDKPMGFLARMQLPTF